MYNRYIPKNDGTFQRRPVNDQRQAANPKSVQQQTAPQQNPPNTNPPKQQERTSIGSFLKNLLPKGFDTDDLIIVLLLILMAGDCEEDQNTALLTLALYFFM